MEQNPIQKSEQVDDIPSSQEISGRSQETNVERSFRSANSQAGAVDLTGVFKQITPSQEARRVPVDSPEGQLGQETRSATNLLGIVPPKPGNSEVGFTQMFRALTESESSLPSSMPQPPVSVKKEERATEQAGKGEFTRLFQKLDSTGESNPQREALPGYSSAVPSAYPEVREGGFTQLLRTLSTSSEVDLPSNHAQPAFHQEAKGPGEFTRIMSRSNVREVQQSDSGETASNASRQTATTIPAELPPPRSPQDIFSNAQISPDGRGNPFASIPSTDPIPAAAPVSSPAHIPSAPNPFEGQKTGRLQEYLPQLLLANVFLSLATLVFVICLLLRGH